MQNTTIDFPQTQGLQSASYPKTPPATCEKMLSNVMFDIDMESLRSVSISDAFIGKHIMTPVSSAGPEVLICTQSEEIQQINDILAYDNKHHSQP